MVLSNNRGNPQLSQSFQLPGKRQASVPAQPLRRLRLI